MKVAVIYGGSSAEKDVSINTGEAVLKACLEIYKCPLWAGSNDPPKIPILVFFNFNLFSNFTVTRNLVFIRYKLI